ncbi:hypothetical protein KAT80_03640 [Candidatus Pacearchaeota archaeon]|nr:hypothetical protein [Candidatus Pacearchaeota archaeon]
MNKHIISTSQGGLSNRIKCLISSMKIAKETNQELVLYWPKDYSCNCNFSNLFENKIKEISKENLRKIIRQKNKKFVLVNDTESKIFSDKINLQYEKIPSEIKREILYYLNKLKIKREILKKVEKFKKSNFSETTIGVHIRGGDFKFIKNKIGHVSNDKQFIKEMKRELEKNPKTKFFLATEDKETENKFLKIFENEIIVYHKKTKKRDEEGSVKEALIEILLLSKTKRILGNFGSTFTEMAWFLGNCKPEIQIIINKQAFERFRLNEKKKNNFINKIKKFVYELITPKHVRFLDRK